MNLRRFLFLPFLTAALVVGCSANVVEEDAEESTDELKSHTACAAMLCAPGTVCKLYGRHARCVPAACTHGGKGYKPGQSFKVRCNTCVCTASGIVCTKMVCPPPPSTCTYGGKTYNHGQSFPSTDGCNTCSCGAGGAIACTEMACACNPASEHNNKYVGASPAQCAVIRFVCEPGTSYFANACGCGCQQPADCPAFVNCMPGPGAPSPHCSAEARGRCPYTEIAF